jgi:hypothetical protein
LWSIDRRFDGLRIAIQQGDQLVANLDRGTRVMVSGDSCLKDLSAGTIAAGGTWTSWTATYALDDRAGHITVTAVPNNEGSDAVLGWAVTVDVEAPPAGLDLHWLERMELIR